MAGFGTITLLLKAEVKISSILLLHWRDFFFFDGISLVPKRDLFCFWL